MHTALKMPAYANYKLIIIICIILIGFYEPVKTMCHNNNLFHGCDLQFFIEANRSQISSGLHKLMTHNYDYFIPRILGPFFLNGQLVDFEGTSTQQLLKHRTLLIFVDVFDKSFKNFEISHLLLSILQRFPHAEFIFLHIDDFKNNRRSYQEYAKGQSPAKLLLFNIHDPDSVYIPCLPCRSNTIIEEKVTATLTLRQIGVKWDAQNLNLRRRIVQLFGPRGVQQGGKCGPTLWHFNKIYSPRFCTISTLRQQFNFTYQHWKVIDKPARQDIFGGISFSTVLLNETLKSMIENNFGMYHVRFEKFKFSVVTSFPSVANNFATFLLPFDSITWILILISTLTISSLVPISVSYSGFGYRNGVIEHICDDLFQITAVLLGQSGKGDMTKIFSNKHLALIVSIVWLFGCYILMENVYQGSIFSFLTVPHFPEVPETIGELLESKIPVLTTTYFTYYVLVRNRSSGTIKYASTMKNLLIPQWKMAMGGNLEYIKSINSLDERLTYVNPVEGTVKGIVQNVSNSIPLGKNFETRETLAIMNHEKDLKYFTDPIRVLGKRFVIDSRDDTGFQTINVMYGFRNYIYPGIYASYKKMLEAGLVDKWANLYLSWEQLFRMRIYGRKVYKKYFAQVNSNVQFQQDFHDCIPVSVKALRYIFALCAVLLSVGWFILYLECKHLFAWHYFIVYRKFWKRTYKCCGAIAFKFSRL